MPETTQPPRNNPDKPYAEAQRRIAEATRTKAKELRLSDLGLTRLPPEIGQLTALTRLDLDNNQLASLPPEIGQLTALTTLDLRNNQLASLPPERTRSLPQTPLPPTQITQRPHRHPRTPHRHLPHPHPLPATAAPHLFRPRPHHHPNTPRPAVD